MKNLTCSFPDCDRPPKGRLCDAHAWQRRQGQALRPIATRAWPDRFWVKVAKSDGCWMWTASVQGDGYGNIWADGTVKLAHRVAYELEVGPIPEGMVLDHLCRERRCVNPSHLEVVTNYENVMRGVGPAPRNRAKTHCIRGHELTGDNLEPQRSGRRCRTCRKMHDLARTEKRRQLKAAL